MGQGLYNTALEKSYSYKGHKLSSADHFSSCGQESLAFYILEDCFMEPTSIILLLNLQSTAGKFVLFGEDDQNFVSLSNEQ